MLRPFDPELKMGLVVDTAKTTGLGYKLFQFDPRFTPACEAPKGQKSRSGPMNFALQGVWLVGAKGSWADLSPIESEVVGYWHVARRLHYHIRGAPVVFGFVDHRSFAELYMKKKNRCRSCPPACSS